MVMCDCGRVVVTITVRTGRDEINAVQLDHYMPRFVRTSIAAYADLQSDSCSWCS